MRQKEIQDLISLIEKYDQTNPKIIKYNIKKYLKKHNKQEMADALEIDIQTIYSWTKAKGNRPSFLTALKLCKLLEIDLEKLLK